MEEEIKQKPRLKWARKLLTFLIAIIISIQMLVPAYAYTLVYIQCSIDLATWEVIAVAVRDEIGISSASNETRRVEKSALESLKSNSKTVGGTNLSLISGLSSDVQNRTKSLADGGNVVAGLVQNLGWFEEKNRVLSFPTDQTRRDSSTSTDFNDAMNVVTDISYDLNQAFSLYCDKNNIAKTPDASAMHTNMVSFLTEIGSSMNSDGTATYEGMDFKWYTEKAPGSDEYINWYMLVYEAFNNYALDGDEAVTSDNVYTSTPNQLTKALVGFFSEMLDGLRGILGMWSMDELLFSTGWRAKGYVGGIFPVSWEPYVWTLFTFMEIFAAMILLYGVLNNVVKKAFSTLNTIARMHFMAQLQDLLVCAVALALLPIILRVVITLSSSFTDIIYNLVPDNISTGEKRTIAESVARYGSGSGSIGGIIAQFLFFGVQVSFNFLYAIRALATAILIIIAPIMIAMISVSSARKQATIQWAKELLAQICIQPIHAFCMAVILLLPTSSHGFDNIIALYALLPFTAVLKGFFFGSSGSWAEQASKRAGKVTTGTLAAGAVGVAGAAVGGAAMVIGGAMGGGNNAGGQNSGSNTGGDPEASGGEGDGSSAPPDLNQHSNTGSNQAGQGSEANADKPSLGETLNDKAVGQRMQSYDNYDAYFDSGSIGAGLRYQASSLGAAVTAGAAAFANSSAGQAMGRAVGAAGQVAGAAAHKVGQFAQNTRAGRALQRVGNAISNSNTAQALRQNSAEAPSLDSTAMGRAANTLSGMGKDAANLGRMGVDKAKTGLKVGAGLALGAAGGVMGGFGGRQLVNLGSGMISNSMGSEKPPKQNESSDEQDLGVRHESSDGANNGSNSPAAPDAIPDANTFAEEYAAMEAQGGGENYAIDRGLGSWIPNNRDGTIEYDFGKEDMASMGITGMHYDKETQSVSAQFDFSKMTAQDRANAQQMVSMWQSGTAAEKSFMQQSGIKNVSPVIKYENGQSKVVGMRMDVDKSEYAKNYGVRFNPSRQATETGQNLSISTPAQTPPQVIPNMSRHMEVAAQNAPQSAIATDVSPVRAAMTGRNSQPSEAPITPPETPPVSQTLSPQQSNQTPPEPVSPQQGASYEHPSSDTFFGEESGPSEHGRRSSGGVDPREELERDAMDG